MANAQQIADAVAALAECMEAIGQRDLESPKKAFVAIFRHGEVLQEALAAYQPVDDAATFRGMPLKHDTHMPIEPGPSDEQCEALGQALRQRYGAGDAAMLERAVKAMEDSGIDAYDYPEAAQSILEAALGRPLTLGESQ